MDGDFVKIIRGDDTAAMGRSLAIELEADFDLTGYKAVFQLANIKKNFDDITSKFLALSFSAEETKELPLGFVYGALKIYDADGLCVTVEKEIGFFVYREGVTDDVPADN